MSADRAPEIIDILMVVDAESILAKFPPGTAAAPTAVVDPLIYLVVKQANAVFGQDSKELKVSARTLDVIRWREATLTLNCAYSAILYKYILVNGDAEVISTPIPLLAAVKAPLPNSSDPLHPGAQSTNSYFWNCNALKAGEITYTFCFMILDRDNKVQGYYSWDPFISVSD